MTSLNKRFDEFIHKKWEKGIIYPDDFLSFLHDEIEKARKEVLKDVRKCLPKEISMKAANNTGSEAGWGVTRGHNDLLKEVHALLDALEKV